MTKYCFNSILNTEVSKMLNASNCLKFIFIMGIKINISNSNGLLGHNPRELIAHVETDKTPITENASQHLQQPR